MSNGSYCGSTPEIAVADIEPRWSEIFRLNRDFAPGIRSAA